MTTFQSFNEVQNALNNDTTNVVEITKTYLQNIAENQHLNAFIEVYSDEALEQARLVDEKLANCSAGKLAGMVVGIKDNLCYKNHKVSASSKILDGFESLFTATSVQRLIDEDAIIIGRLNCDEFAMGSANENTIYGTVKNPLDNSKVAGGSSGGSAAAVSAGLCIVALGSDTGGSIRQPAAFCGIVGIKPTYSRVSRYGLIAYASSFDQIGPLTNNVSDAALILEVIAGKDDFDSTVSKKDVDNYSTAKFDNKPKKIAYISECLNRKGLDPEVKEFIENKIDKLKSEGHIVEPISFPYLDLLVPTYYVLTTAEASSNLARFAGVHYGYRSENITDLESTYIHSRTEGFGEEVKRRIMLGTFVLSAGYHDAYFTKAQKIRRLIKDKTNEMFEEYDFVVSPTTPHTPFEIGKKQTDPTVMYLEDIFTVQANLAGNPAISLPLGKHSNGLPIGLHLMADNFKEADLFAFSKYLSN
ncbi:Asp-tRNA(Asn)/Glu-tRNA(Gln) amidotransferase subunit GatA [bacterium]|nr:Asp-tRNA(Asn)/Glu-tRNA(Gln) amidotransferase subunit GatA [Flavobacteriales bacterium]MBT6650682.1 Asp-tRNA(Asn)/Glu-tRNA(Gln) amidotransferase subunit GatA [Flavobacteriales bacterium]MDB3870385.1 Asp-tRNA(Asn)/Glu-tRNA(Gln) amidotransferase subunit GatA [bacterium]